MPLYYQGRPDIQATYYVGTDKKNGNPKKIDLSPYITALNISKDMSQPAGMWELILVTDFIKKGVLDPKELTPFDYIEMRVRSDPGLARPFYYTRGFVDNVTLATDGAPSGGKLQRQITINGRDYGALLQNYQVYNITADQQAQQFVMARLVNELALGDRAEFQANELVYRIIHIALNQIHILGNLGSNKDKIKDPAIPGLKKQQPFMREVVTRANFPRKLGTVLTGDNFLNFNGTLDELIRMVQSPPWGEYFIRDDWDQPRVYFRIPPYLDRSGNFANKWVKSSQGGTDAYNTELELVWVELQPQDIVHTSLSRSQNEVYTFFVSTASNIIQGDILQAILANEFNDGKSNINPSFDGLATGKDADKRLRRAARFGFRPLQVQSPLIAGSSNGGFQFTASDKKNSSGLGTMREMNEWLVNSFGRMEELESGTITCRGIMGTRRGHNEIAARIGDYIYFQKEPGDNPFYYYVQALDITWSEGSPLTTTFQVTRGEKLNNKEHPYKVF